MRVLIACEFSGIVRDSFIKKGHDTWSCDLLPTETKGPHLQKDVLFILEDNWDLMVAHPPCTHLSSSGARWFKDKAKEQAEALNFIRVLMEAPIEKIAIENPIGVISTHFRKPDQIIQPWMFGHDASKSTCLWLKNLPILKSTKIVLPRKVNGKNRWSNQTDSGQNKLTPSPTRGMDRSRTYQGIADAMANQWG